MPAVTTDRTAGILRIVGSAVFWIGAAVGVPRVFAQRDPGVRLRMLTERLRAWRIVQPLYRAGPVIALLAIGPLVGDFRTWPGCAALGADVVFLAGYVLSGDIPPFVFYVLLALVGVAVL